MGVIKDAFPEFEKPAVAVDTVILRVKDVDVADVNHVPLKQLQVLLVKKPGKENWHLPGTILRLGETPSDAINRVIAHKENVNNIAFEQLYTVADDVERDPRGHVISIVYIGMINDNEVIENAGGYEQGWFWVTKPSTSDRHRKFVFESSNEAMTYLEYDHHKIINDTIARLQGKLLYTDIGFNFIGKEFTLKKLENTFNAINERVIPGFRRIIANKVDKTGKMEVGNSYRPAELYVKKE